MSRNIAVLVTNLFEDSEFTEPVKALEDAGHSTVTIDVKGGETVVGKKGTEVRIDKGIKEVKPEDFDALLLPGGYSPDKLRADDDVLAFVKSFAEEKKPIFAICHGPQLLINAEAVKGKKVTSAKQVAVDLRNAGALWEDSEVVIDGTGLISSRKPDDIPAFNKAILKALEA